MPSVSQESPPAPVAGPPGAPEFLIHNEGDHVGVAVRDIEPGEAKGVFMDSDRAVSVTVTEAVPLGHKIALVALGEGDDVIEYGVRVGLTRQPVAAGSLVHTHNLRSARWQASV